MLLVSDLAATIIVVISTALVVVVVLGLHTAASGRLDLSARGDDWHAF
jgi:hypothetical protein